MTTPRISTRAKQRMRTGNESRLVTAILMALKLKGVWAWRVNSGLTVFAAQAGHARRVVKGAEAGTPDILIVLPIRHTSLSLGIEGMSVDHDRLGVLCGIEVKTETGKQSASQKIWQARAEQSGVRYGVARSISEALELVRKWSGA